MPGISKVSARNWYTNVQYKEVCGEPQKKVY